MKLHLQHRLQILLLLSSVLLFSNCYTKKQALSKFCKTSLNIKDSTVFIYADSIRWVTARNDSTIIHPKTYQRFDLESLCDSLGRLHAINIKTKTGSSSVNITTSGNRLIIITNCDSVVEHYRHVSDSLIQRSTANNVELHDVIRIVEPAVPPWYRLMPNWLWWYIGIITAYLAFNVAKFISPSIIKKLIP